MTVEGRDEKGRFLKGVVSNPKGRPKLAARSEYKAWAETRAMEWLEKLEQMGAEDPRVLMWLLDQHMGKAIQAQEISGPGGDTLLVRYVEGPS